ncbi:MAG: exonuclease SbcCD subunit D C-terminal domain-containing protein [Lachnospiraceae bacterium]|nr:exonuclease SbcCD subunit D C-terminal domain-containing protein [Lachnospiraceae bacterium]
MTGDYPKEVPDAYIRVKLTDSPVTLETFARLNELFPNLLETAGTTLNDDGMELTLTPEDLEQRKNNPEEIFRQYYIDSFGMEPDEHLTSLFEKALEMYSKEVEE